MNNKVENEELITVKELSSRLKVSAILNEMEIIDNRIENLFYRRDLTVTDRVTGSNPHFPYNKMTFTVVGTPESNRVNYDLARDRRQELEFELDDSIREIKDEYIQRIFTYKYIYQMPFKRIATRMEKSENEIKKIHDDYLNQIEN